MIGFRHAILALLPLLFGVTTSCGGSGTLQATSTAMSSTCSEVSASLTAAKTCQSVGDCPTAGKAWVPSVAGASGSNHDTSVTVEQTVLEQTGVPVLGLAQAAPSTVEVSFSIDMTEDLGQNGSLSLEAEVTGFPSGITGTAYPVLVYLSDGVNDYINLPRSSTVAGDCATSGYYICGDSVCTANPGCSPSWPSAYMNRTQWEQHQVTNNNSEFSSCGAYPSVNVFPTCNWTQGSNPPTAESPGCAFNETFFPASTTRLRYGGTYTAKYVLLASDYSSLAGQTAGIKLTVTKKKDANAGGAVDLNVILVGDQNVNDSYTAKGQQNLNLLFDEVYDLYNQGGTAIQLGNINVVEWPSAQGGEPYATIDASEIGFMFENSAPLLPSGSSGRAINVFLVSTLPESSGTLGGLTILGISGAVGGPAAASSAVSGTIVATFNELATFNSNCTVGGSCPQTSQDSGFVILGETIAHEIGHYLGLNHPSESSATVHDQVYDTPLCTTTDPGTGYTTIASCLLDDTNLYAPSGNTCNTACGSPSNATGIYCSTAPECQFNYVMWWTSKRYDPATNQGDGNLFSDDQGQIMNYSSYVQ
jgi:hypothetical protein